MDEPRFQKIVEDLQAGALTYNHPLEGAQILDAIRALGEDACCSRDFYLGMAAALTAGALSRLGLTDPQERENAITDAYDLSLRMMRLFQATGWFDGPGEVFLPLATLLLIHTEVWTRD